MSQDFEVISLRPEPGDYAYAFVVGSRSGRSRAVADMGP